MFYTKKGDDGKTNVFGCDQRVSKSSNVTEALGALDEANSFLGISKIEAKKSGLNLNKELSLAEIVHQVQENLFHVQAELAGAKNGIDKNKLETIEKIIDLIEAELPDIKTFFISGGTGLAALFDFSRTLIRRAERRMTAVQEEGVVKLEQDTLSYINRVSSLLYALARLSNHKSGIVEESPSYK